MRDGGSAKVLCSDYRKPRTGWERTYPGDALVSYSSLFQMQSEHSTLHQLPARLEKREARGEHRGVSYRARSNRGERLHLSHRAPCRVARLCLAATRLRALGPARHTDIQGRQGYLSTLWADHGRGGRQDDCPISRGGIGSADVYGLLSSSGQTDLQKRRCEDPVLVALPAADPG